MSPSAALKATAVVPGVGYAPAVWARPRPALPQEGTPIPGGDVDLEIERFRTAYRSAPVRKADAVLRAG